MKADAFWKEYADTPYELVHGKVVEWQLASSVRASSIALTIGSEILMFVVAHHLGMVTSASGAYLLDPYTIRSPRVGYFSNQKAAQITDPYSYAPFAPDLSVEVMSPGDDETELEDKLSSYLKAGTRLIWVVWLERKEVVVHRPNHAPQVYALWDTLSGEDVLPNFVLAVADLFANNGAR